MTIHHLSPFHPLVLMKIKLCLQCSTVTATDADGDALTFSTNFDNIVIHPTTGVLTFTMLQTFEPVGIVYMGHDFCYRWKRYCSTRISVTVLDVNEAPLMYYHQASVLKRSK